MNRWTIVILSGILISGAHAAEQGFDKADADKDGRVSRAEYTELLKQRFERLDKGGYQKAADVQFKRKDKNKDGYLDEEEFAIKVKQKKK